MRKYVLPYIRPVVWTGEDYRFREVGFSYRAIAAEKFHTDVNLKRMDRRAPNNSKNWQWTMKSDVVLDDWHLFRMVE